MKFSSILILAAVVCHLAAAQDTDFEVDVSPSIEGAINALISGTRDADRVRSSFTAALKAQPTQADYASAPSSVKADLDRFNKDSRDSKTPLPLARWRPIYRRRIHCKVTYSPNWRICCWLVYWWK